MAHIAVTPGSGAFVATYADANGDSNPGGVAAYLVGATATPVDATHQMPVLATQAGTWTVAISGTVAVASVGGNVEVTNDVGNPIPVSGTVAATQSGTWTIQPGNTANTTAWLVTGAGGTFPVTAAALPLPAGAATAAKQAALGTAGAAAADVLTIQGIASMTPVKVDGSAVTQPVSLLPATTGGLSTSSTISAATTNATNIKASAGQIFGYAIFNTTGSPLYVKLYDSATAPTAGSGTPMRRLMVPANGGLERTMPNGLQFTSGIGFTATANPADNDTAAVTLNALLINIDYK